MNARFTFPARAGIPAVNLFWIDGGMKFPRPNEFDEDGAEITEIDNRNSIMGIC